MTPDGLFSKGFTPELKIRVGGLFVALMSGFLFFNYFVIFPNSIYNPIIPMWIYILFYCLLGAVFGFSVSLLFLPIFDNNERQLLLNRRQ